MGKGHRRREASSLGHHWLRWRAWTSCNRDSKGFQEEFLASDSAGIPRDFRLRSSGRFRQDVQEALEGVSFIAQHMKSDDLDQSVSC